MFRPLGDRVLIRPINKEKTTASGIFLPDSAQKESQQGEVVRVGDGRTDNGKQVDFESLGLRPGVKVIFDKFGPDDVELEGEELKVAKLNQILGIIEHDQTN